MEYKILLKIFLDLFKIDKINYGETRILTVAHDNDRNYFYKGKYYSPLIDTIEDDINKKAGINCISVARIISEIKGDLSYGTVFSPEGKFARALIQKRLKNLFSPSTNPYSSWEEDVWGKILDETKPSKVIGILPSRELCFACHQRNIWVADVQHGIIAKNHPWYGKKYRQIDKIEHIPNSFLVWDQASSDVILEWANDLPISINIIGNRWLSRFKNPKLSDEIVRESTEKINKFFDKKPQKPVILISLSWGEEETAKGEVPESIIKIIQDTADDYYWLIRLHPNQVKGFASHEFDIFLNQYNKLLKNMVEWEISTYSPLPAVLGITSLHISWMSSVAIEAAQMGIKSALLSPKLRGDFSGDYFYDYHKNGMIDFIQSEKNLLLNWICTTLDSQNSGSQDYLQYDYNYNNLLDFLIGT